MTRVIEPARQAHGTAPDDAVLAAVAAGDHAALEELYSRHAPWLTVRLQRRCRDPELVDTAIQEAFLAAWRQAARYQPTGSVSAWLWTIALRRLIDLLRRRAPPTPVEDLGALTAVVTDEVPLALADTDLGAIFARLAPELQAVLAATALDGLTTAEAAVLLGIPQGTVKTRLARARAQLQEMLPR
jgi:RNA polymerase sigma-70 factor (ECF subfamily)